MKNKEQLSDFLKWAYKHNKIKDVSEAFEKYPPEEEWHKGKVENVLHEPKEIYTFYNIGDIVYVKNYCYSDGMLGTNHLFVIVDQDNIAVPIENFGMIISSKIYKTKYPSNILLKSDEINGLTKDSIVKTDELYKIYTSQILFKIGSVNDENIETYKKFYEESNKI